MTHYKNLEAYKVASEIVILVYRLTKNWSKEEMFGLTNQIRRTAVSIPSNIAEGSGRGTPKDTLQFNYIARGSCFEVETQAELGLKLGFLNQEDYEVLSERISFCNRLINGMINHLKEKATNL
jgi:four helix bundle protein